MEFVNRYMRQMSYVDMEKAKNTKITLVGAGGIGSWTALCLAKTGFVNINLYDFDKVEEHNVSNQAFSTKDIGKYKVDATNQLLEHMGEKKVKTYCEKFSGDNKAGDILIMGVDSIESRKEIFDIVQKDYNLKFVIDGRMGLTTTHIFSIDMTNPEDIDYYYKSLEGEHSDLPCTARATMCTAMNIGSRIVSNVICYINNDYIYRHSVFDIKSNALINMK